MIPVLFQGGSLNGVQHQLRLDEFMIAVQRPHGWEVYARSVQFGPVTIFQFRGVNAFQETQAA